MKLAVVGCRDFTRYGYIRRVLSKHPCTHIVSGGARGVDSLAKQYADENNIVPIVFKAEWDKYGKKAGFIRNELIVKECDELVAFGMENLKEPKTVLIGQEL